MWAWIADGWGPCAKCSCISARLEARRQQGGRAREGLNIVKHFPWTVGIVGDCHPARACVQLPILRRSVTFSSHGQGQEGQVAR